MATTATSSSGSNQNRNNNTIGNESVVASNESSNGEEGAITNEPSRKSSSPQRLASSEAIIVYDVEHLATFSTNGNQETSVRSTTSDDECSLNIQLAKNALPSTGAGLGKTCSNTTTPKVALQRLFELEKLSGIWTQHMQIELRDDHMLIVDCETNSVVESFHRDCVTKPEAFNQYNDIYNNIVVFIIQQPRSHQLEQGIEEDKETKNRRNSNKFDSRKSDISDENNHHESSANSTAPEEGELHIFQCVSHKAQQLVSNILTWKSQPPTTMTNSDSSKILPKSQTSATNSNAINLDKKTAKDFESTSSNRQAKNESNPTTKMPSPVSASSGSSTGKPVVTVASSASTNENVPIVNVNVRETVQVFNQIAALREKSKPTSPISHSGRPLSDASVTSSNSTPASSSAAPNALPETSKMPLSPEADGGQLYKQRSIRATLAHKYTAEGSIAAAAGGGDETRPHQKSASKLNDHHHHQASSSTTNSGSGASSSSVTSSQVETKQSSGYHSHGHSQGQLLNGARNAPAGCHRELEPTGKQQAMLTNGAVMSAASRSHQQQMAGTQAAQAHKSSKSQSRPQQQPQRTSQSNSSHSQASSSTSQSQLDQVSTNESYVSVLNHCFDDIEKFIIRLQQAVAGQAALRDLQAKRKAARRAGGREQAGSSPPVSASELAILSTRARGPNEDDYFEILSKFKLAFNLLAKLKGCIHEPNAPELVHFLFTPLAIIIESARNASPPIDPRIVGIPYLNQDALDLLSNCCTSKESDMWISLGPNWTQTIDMNLLKASRLPSSFQPIFSDGWAPIIGELELIGLVAPASVSSGGGECGMAAAAASAPVELSEPHHHPPATSTSNNNHRHHHHESASSRRVPPYAGLDSSLMDNPSLMAGVKPLDHPNNGTKMQPQSSKEYRKKSAAPAPPFGQRGMSHDAVATLEPRPYPDPYSYRDGEPHHDERELQQGPPGYRGSSSNDHHHSHGAPLNGRHNAPLEPSRRPKHGSRPPIPIDHYPGPYGPDDGAMVHHPAMGFQRSADEDSRLDVDLMAHQGGPVLHSDDYTELHHDPYLIEHEQQQHRSSSKVIMPGPSSLNQQYHYRGERSVPHGESSNQRYRYSHKAEPKAHLYGDHHRSSVLPSYEHDYLTMEAADHEVMLLDLGPAQLKWLYELQSRGALIVRVLFTREANNDKELSVRRGEILEVLDDTRKWWRARNIDMQVAHVPHTIVAVMQGYQTLDELLANSELQPPDHYAAQHQWHEREDKRSSKTAGAFRYF